MPRADKGWVHFEEATRLWTIEALRTGDDLPQWTAVDTHLQLAASAARESGDMLLLGVVREALGCRWEMEGFRGEALAQWEGALPLLRQSSIADADRVKRRLANWYEYPRVFVSYAHADARRVRRIVDALTLAKCEVVFDSDFLGGHDLSALIDWAMAYAGLYVICWSSKFAGRPFTTLELERAYAAVDAHDGAAGRRIILVRLDDTPLPEQVGEELWIDAAGRTTQKSLQRIVQAVRRTRTLSPRHEKDATRSASEISL